MSLKGKGEGEEKYLEVQGERGMKEVNYTAKACEGGNKENKERGRGE